MMSPTWILDVFAALMLVIATVSGTRLAAARLPAGWQLAGRRSEVVQAGPRSWPRGPAGADHDVSGHGAVHLLQCAAMVYLFAAVTTSGSMPMTGAGAAPQSLESPALALAFASVLAAYTAWDIGRLPVRRDPRVVAPVRDVSYEEARRSSSCWVNMVTPPVAKVATSAPAFPISGELRPVR